MLAEEALAPGLRQLAGVELESARGPEEVVQLASGAEHVDGEREPAIADDSQPELADRGRGCRARRLGRARGARRYAGEERRGDKRSHQILPGEPSSSASTAGASTQETNATASFPGGLPASGPPGRAAPAPGRRRTAASAGAF